ncbi:hypothetical protein RCIP0047_00057 [Klebsiella phage RCIP0047]
MITLTIPNDDHIALRAFGKALEEMALAHGAEPRKTTVDTSEATAVTDELVQTALQIMNEPEVDTTAQQVESLAPHDGRSIEVTREMVELCIPVKPDIDPPTTDSTGTPWDERIHSASKALNADGTWRLRRKLKDMDEAEWAAFVESVKGELHTQTPVVTNEEVKTPNPVEIGEPTREEVDNVEPPVTPPGDDFHTDAGVVTEQTVVGIPPIPVPPPVVVVPPVPEVAEWDFPRLMTFLTERHGKIDVATVNALLAQDGMSSVQELNVHPDKIGPFVTRVKAYLGE